MRRWNRLFRILFQWQDLNIFVANTVLQLPLPAGYLFKFWTDGRIPPLVIKKNASAKPVRRILIYNNYRGAQHAFILVSAV